MSDTTTDQVRAHVHGMWAAVAGQWREHADEVDERSADVATAMLAAVDVHPGEHLLELACGSGGVGIAAAERLGGSRQEGLSDVGPVKGSIAGGRDRQSRVGNGYPFTHDLEKN